MGYFLRSIGAETSQGTTWGLPSGFSTLKVGGGGGAPNPTKTTLELFVLVNTLHGTDCPGVVELSPGNLKGAFKFVDLKIS